MDVAVIMSVYASECPEKFSRAIESILNQVVQPNINIRIYLGVDGPVSEALQAAIVDYEKRIYRLTWFASNRGLAVVLNDLIATLEDEALIFRMDTDDISYPNRFQRQIDYLALHPKIDILGTSIVEVEEGTDAKRLVHFSRKSDWSARKYIARGVPVAHPTVCFRKTVFQKVGGYPTVRNNEDIALWFRCLRQNLNIENLREPLYEFTVNSNFLGRRGAKKAFTEFVVYAKGIWLLHGVTLDYLFPLARFALRIAPKFVQTFAYASRFRGREIE